MKKLTFAVLFLCSGCLTDGQLADRTQGAVGCRSSDIVISDRSSGLYGITWTATCGGKRYLCSTGPSTNCAPEPAAK